MLESELSKLKLRLTSGFDGEKIYCKRNAVIGGTCFESECSNMINRKGLVHGAVTNSCWVLSILKNEKRAHLNIFVKKNIVVTAKTS